MTRPKVCAETIAQYVYAVAAQKGEENWKYQQALWKGGLDRAIAACLSMFSGLKITDVLLALFSGLLWWVTNDLAKSTKKLWLDTNRLASGAEDQHETLKASVAVAERAADIAKASAEAASRGARATERTLELTVRPWMKTEISFVTDLMMRDTFAQLNIRVRSVNVGSAPAIGVGASAIMFPYHPGDNPQLIFNEIYNFPASRDVGDTVFVGDAYESVHILTIDNYALNKIRLIQPIAKPPAEIFIWGFVGYWGAASHMLRSPFLFKLVRTSENGAGWYQRIDLHSDTPKEELSVQSSWLFGVTKADYGPDLGGRG